MRPYVAHPQPQLPVSQQRGYSFIVRSQNETNRNDTGLVTYHQPSPKQPHHSDSGGAWVLSEAFRSDDDNPAFYTISQQGMIEMEDSLREMALLRVQSLSDDKKRRDEDNRATRSTQEPKVSKELPLRRPGPDIDEEEDAPFRPQPQRRASYHHQPIMPIRGSCQCCFEEISTINSLSCTSQDNTSAHIFCKDCLRRYVQEWVFGGADYQLKTHHTNTLPCMAIDCQEGYIPHEVIEGVCSEGLWENYQEKIFRTEAIAVAPAITAIPQEIRVIATRSYSDPEEVSAGLADDSQPTRERSSSAGDESDLLPAIQEAVVPKKVASGKKTAEPAKMIKAEKRTKTLNRVAEAMTLAKVRKCPMCDVAFLKESGCNKMKCPSCKTHMCYICRLPVPRLGYGE